MESTIHKLINLRQSVHKLESVLQEVWSHMEEIEEDVEFKNLMKQAQGKSALSNILDEIDNTLGQIPEDGTAAVDLEDAVSELIDWLEENKS